MMRFREEGAMQGKSHGRGTLARLVLTRRLQTGMTQGELAERAEVSARTVRNIESGAIADPRAQTVRLLAEALFADTAERAQFIATSSSQEVDLSIAAPADGVDSAAVDPANEPRFQITPAQLPHAMPAFVGREPELDHLSRILASARDGQQALQIVTVLGTAGVGKTSLAVHWAHRVAGHFPDGQLYVNLRGFDPVGAPMTATAALQGFLEALGEPPERIPTDPERQASLFRTLVAGRRILVVLDNAGETQQVRPLLPGSRGCFVLVTSRRALGGLMVAEGAIPLTLDLPPVEDARRILARRIGIDRVADEPLAVDEIIQCCSRLPLALAVVAARAATHPRFPLRALADELRIVDKTLDAFMVDGQDIDFRAVFSWSYRGLPPGSARLFRLLGVHPGPDISAAAAASLAGVPVVHARHLLAELTAAHLIDEYVPGRFTFHDLLRTHAVELARLSDTDDSRREALARVLDHYRQTSHNAASIMDRYRDSFPVPSPRPRVCPEQLSNEDEAMQWFGSELPVLRATIRQAIELGFDSHVWQLTWALTDYLERRALWQDWADLHEAALQATRRLADPIAEAGTRRHAAVGCALLGQYDASLEHLRRALELYTAQDDRFGQARTHHNLGKAFEEQGRYDWALHHAQQTLNLDRECQTDHYIAGALNGVGWYHALLGEYDQAFDYCQQAIVLHRQSGDRRAMAYALDSLGYIQHGLGNNGEAVKYYEQALALFHHLGIGYTEAKTLIRLGAAHEAAGNYDAAITAWQRASNLLDELGYESASGLRRQVERALAAISLAEETVSS